MRILPNQTWAFIGKDDNIPAGTEYKILTVSSREIYAITPYNVSLTDNGWIWRSTPTEFLANFRRLEESTV